MVVCFSFPQSFPYLQTTMGAFCSTQLAWQSRTPGKLQPGVINDYPFQVLLSALDELVESKSSLLTVPFENPLTFTTGLDATSWASYKTIGVTVSPGDYIVSIDSRNPAVTSSRTFEPVPLPPAVQNSSNTQSKPVYSITRTASDVFSVTIYDLKELHRHFKRVPQELQRPEIISAIEGMFSIYYECIS